VTQLSLLLPLPKQIVPIWFEIDRRSKASIPIITTRGVQVGLVEVSSETFSTGTIIRMSGSYGNRQTGDRSCGHHKVNTVVSPTIELKAEAPDGTEITRFDRPVTIKLMSLLEDNESDELCLGSSNSKDQILKCTATVETFRNLSDNYVVLKGKTTRFTSFAILLGGTLSDGDSCSSSWTWKASVGLLASAFVIVVFVACVGRTKRLAPFVYGFKDGAYRLSDVIKRNIQNKG